MHCGDESAAATAAENAAANFGGGVDKMGGGLLSRLLHKLMRCNSNNDDVPSGGDPYVRGPTPIFPDKLSNVALFTSSALAVQAYGNGKCNQYEF